MNTCNKVHATKIGKRMFILAGMCVLAKINMHFPIFVWFLTIIHKILIQKYILFFLCLIIRMLFFQVLLQCSFRIILFPTIFTYKKFLGPCMEKHVAIQCFLSHVFFGALGATKLFWFFLEPNHVYFYMWDLVLWGTESLCTFGAPQRRF